MELNISLLYQQINALLIGTTLYALALFRDRRFVQAGILLTLATNVKMYPGLFALALLFPVQKKYWLGLILGSVIALLAPAIWVGFRQNVELHQFWIGRLTEAASYVRDDLNLASVLARQGHRYLGSVLECVLVAVSLLSVLLLKNYRSSILWIVVGSTLILLINPRTESPTFVYVAPAYLFLTAVLFKLKDNKVLWLGLSVLILCGFAMTFSFTDIWPKFLWNPGTYRYATKTIATLLMWTLAVFLAFKTHRRLRA